MNTETNLDKEAWILDHFSCPSCRAQERLVQEGDLFVCPACKTAFPQDAGAMSFLTPQMRRKFGIDETTNVSAHGYDENARKILDRGGMVLDCGAGKKNVTFPNLIQCEVVDYPHVDVLAVNQALPFQDACFDAVLSLDVLEHVDQPFDCAAEILRVLKPGGKIYCNVPFLQREHGYPHHYFGMTRMGIRRLFGDQIEVEDHQVPLSGHPIWALWMMLQTYRDGLPTELRDEFHRLRVADILDLNPVDWMREKLVTELGEEARWRIATTTALLAHKRETDG